MKSLTPTRRIPKVLVFLKKPSKKEMFRLLSANRKNNVSQSIYNDYCGRNPV